MNDDKSKDLVVYMSLTLMVGVLLFFSVLFHSCTLSFTNISTHGSATDLLDQDQSPTNDVKPNLVIPLNQGL